MAILWQIRAIFNSGRDAKSRRKILDKIKATVADPATHPKAMCGKAKIWEAISPVRSWLICVRINPHAVNPSVKTMIFVKRFGIEAEGMRLIYHGYYCFYCHTDSEWLTPFHEMVMGQFRFYV